MTNNSFDLKANKFIGIHKVNKYKIGLLDGCVLPYPCSSNTIAYLNLNTHTISDYLFLNECCFIDKLFVFAHANLIAIENKISQKNTLCLSRKLSEIDEQIELNTDLIDIDISSSRNLMCLITENENCFCLSLWSLSENCYKLSQINLDFLNKNSNKISIRKITFCPDDYKKLVLYGDKLLVGLSVKNEHLHFSWEYSSSDCYLSHLWFNSNILIGTNAGNLLIFNENQLLKQIEVDSQKKLDQLLNPKNWLICICGGKLLNIFKANSASDFEFHHSFELASLNDDLGIHIDEYLLDVTLNEEETYLVMQTNLNRIYRVELTKELRIIESNSKLIKNYHSVKIVSIDVCKQKSLILTCCSNKSIKLWNIETGDLELGKYFDEAISGVTLHPTGFYLAISFYSKIDYCTLLNDQLILNKSFKYQSNDCKFSSAGHLIGLISNKSIDVYNIWTYENLNVLKFCNGKLTHFEWFNQDEHIAACTNVGLICIWNVISGEKIVEYCEKTIQFTRLEINLTSTELIIFAFDHLNNLRLLNANLKSANNLENINLVFENYLYEPNTRKLNATNYNKLRITCFTYYKSLIIMGSDKGHILVKDYVSDDNNEKRFQYHNSSICQLKLVITKSKKVKLISCSLDGLIVVLDLISDLCNSSSAALILSELVEVARSDDDILQTRNEIRKKHTYDLNLQLSLIEKNEDQAYQVRLKEIEHKEQTRTINYEAKLELTRLRTHLKEIKLNEEKKLEFHRRRLDELTRKLENDLELVKHAAENELSDLYELHQNLACKYKYLQSLSSALVGELFEVTKPDSLNRFNKEVEVYKQYKMYDLKQEIKANLVEMNKKTRILKRETSLIELEGDKQIEELKLKNSLILSESLQESESLRVKLSLVRKQLSDVKSRIRLIKQDEIDHEENLLGVRKKYFTRLEHVESFKKLVNSTSVELSRKEKREQQLRLQLEHLKKYEYINEYKLNELKADLEPLMKENSELKEMMQMNQANLEQVLSVRIRRLRVSRENMLNLKTQIDKRIQRAKSKFNYVNNFEFRLSRLNADLEDLALKPKNLLDLYHKFKATLIENKYFD